MKKLIFIPLSFIWLCSFSQTLQIEWQQCYGGSDYDAASDLVQSESGYYVVGSILSNDGFISFLHGGQDGWLLKTDISGNLVWEKSYGGSNGEHLLRILPALNNCYYLLGSSYSSDGDISNDPYPESTDFWIVKIDSSGNILWDRILGGNILDQMWTGTPTIDGGVVAIGWTGSNDGDITLNYGMYDMWMVKLNSEGEKEWDFSLGTSGFDFGHAIVQTSDGGYLVGGSSRLEEGGNLTCIPHSWMAEAILVKLDAERNIEWQRCYGGTEDDGVWSLMEIEDGYIIVGYARSNDGDITGWHGEADIWILKVDFEGNIIWQKCYGGYRDEYAANIFRTDDEGFIIFGMTLSNDGDVIGNHSLSEYDNDIWVFKINSDGNLLWQQCIGGIGDERLDWGVIQKIDNQYVIAGQTDFGPSYDVECDPYGVMGSDYWVFEVTDTTIGLEENYLSDEDIKVRPNPAETEITLAFQNTDHHNNILLECYNIYGQKVHSEKIWNGQQETRIDLRGWAKGLYFAVVKSEGKMAGTGRFVVR